MVSENLQTKFYTTLDRMKDGSNDNLIESIKEGAKTIFEGFKSDYARPTSAETYKATPDDLSEVTGTSMHIDEPRGKLNDEEEEVYIEPEEPVTKEYGDEVDIFDIFNDNDDVSHAYDDLDYAAVAESVEYKKALNDMKDGKNDALIEALIDGLEEVSKEGYKAAFEDIVDKDADEIALDKFVDAFSNSITDLSLRRDGMTECTVMFAGEPVGKVSVVMDRDIGDAGRYTPKFTIISTATGEQFEDLPESGPFGASDDTYRKLADNAASFIVLHDKEKLSSLMYDGAGTECDAGVEAVQAEAERKSI